MQQNFMGVGFGVVAGLMFGYLLGGAGGAEPEAPITKGLAAQSEALAAIGADVEGLGARLAALETDVSGQMGALTAKVDAVPASVMAEVEKSASTLQASLSGEMSALSAKMGEIAATATVAAAPAASAPTPAAAAAAAPAPAAAASEPVGSGIGQTVMLLDGAARVFVSGIDADAGTARVAINGLTVQTIGGWQEAKFEADGKICQLLADSITPGKVLLTASCP